MKRQALSLISLLSLLSLLLVAGSAVAQSLNVRANVPFSFSVDNKTLPAGTYAIRRAGFGDDKMLILQRREGGGSMIMGTNAAETLKPADQTKLVFHKYGTQYFLSEIWVEGNQRGNCLPKSAHEKELARTITPESLEIVANVH